mmetsp:Transcript_6198/g.6978  ORF Transcript_6198/g.6978 Transcript_6198/m.6978 type:complete len:1445 (+) Transcript_6198:269-4603(+)
MQFPKGSSERHHPESSRSRKMVDDWNAKRIERLQKVNPYSVPTNSNRMRSDNVKQENQGGLFASILKSFPRRISLGGQEKKRSEKPIDEREAEAKVTSSKENGHDSSGRRKSFKDTGHYLIKALGFGSYRPENDPLAGLSGTPVEDQSYLRADLKRDRRDPVTRYVNPVNVNRSVHFSTDEEFENDLGEATVGESRYQKPETGEGYEKFESEELEKQTVTRGFRAKGRNHFRRDISLFERSPDSESNRSESSTKPSARYTNRLFLEITDYILRKELKRPKSAFRGQEQSKVLIHRRALSNSVQSLQNSVFRPTAVRRKMARTRAYKSITHDNSQNILMPSPSQRKHRKLTSSQVGGTSLGHTGADLFLQESLLPRNTKSNSKIQRTESVDHLAAINKVKWEMKEVKQSQKLNSERKAAPSKVHSKFNRFLETIGTLREAKSHYKSQRVSGRVVSTKTLAAQRKSVEYSSQSSLNAGERSQGMKSRMDSSKDLSNSISKPSDAMSLDSRSQSQIADPSSADKLSSTAGFLGTEANKSLDTKENLIFSPDMLKTPMFISPKSDNKSDPDSRRQSLEQSNTTTTTTSNINLSTTSDMTTSKDTSSKLSDSSTSNSKPTTLTKKTTSEFILTNSNSNDAIKTIKELPKAFKSLTDSKPLLPTSTNATTKDITIKTPTATTTTTAVGGDSTKMAGGLFAGISGDSAKVTQNPKLVSSGLFGASTSSATTSTTTGGGSGKIGQSLGGKSLFGESKLSSSGLVGSSLVASAAMATGGKSEVKPGALGLFASTGQKPLFGQSKSDEGKEKKDAEVPEVKSGALGLFSGTTSKPSGAGTDGQKPLFGGQKSGTGLFESTTKKEGDGKKAIIEEGKPKLGNSSATSGGLFAASALTTNPLVKQATSGGNMLFNKGGLTGPSSNAAPLFSGPLGFSSNKDKKNSDNSNANEENKTPEVKPITTTSTSDSTSQKSQGLFAATSSTTSKPLFGSQTSSAKPTNTLFGASLTAAKPDDSKKAGGPGLFSGSTMSNISKTVEGNAKPASGSLFGGQSLFGSTSDSTVSGGATNKEGEKSTKLIENTKTEESGKNSDKAQPKLKTGSLFGGQSLFGNKSKAEGTEKTKVISGLVFNKPSEVKPQSRSSLHGGGGSGFGSLSKTSLSAKTTEKEAPKVSTQNTSSTTISAQSTSGMLGSSMSKPGTGMLSTKPLFGAGGGSSAPATSGASTTPSSALGVSRGGLFGSNTAKSATTTTSSTPSSGGLGLSAPTNSNNPQSLFGGASLFPSKDTKSATTASAFSTTATTATTAAPATGGLFGGVKSLNSGSGNTAQSLFAGTTPSTAGGLFGSNSTGKTQAGPLFGGSTSSAMSGTPDANKGSLFGGSNGGGSLFGGSSSSSSTTASGSGMTLFGAKMPSGGRANTNGNGASLSLGNSDKSKKGEEPQKMSRLKGKQLAKGRR